MEGFRLLRRVSLILLLWSNAVRMVRSSCVSLGTKTTTTTTTTTSHSSSATASTMRSHPRKRRRLLGELKQATTTTTVSSTTTTPFTTSYWTRQIQQCGKDVSKCTRLLDDYKQQQQQQQQHTTTTTASLPSSILLAALNVCGKARDSSTALRIYHNECQQTTSSSSSSSDACCAAVISICGRCKLLTEALDLLPTTPTTTPPNTTTTTSTSSVASCYNAAIAACGHNHAWQQALHIYRDRMPHHCISLLTCNALLTTLARCKRGQEAQDVLDRMNNLTPDAITYHHVVVAWIRQGNRLEEAHRLLRDMKDTRGMQPKQATYDALIAAYTKRKEWKRVTALEEEQRRQHSTTTRAATFTHLSDAAALSSGTFRHWNGNGLTKIGRGKTSYWKLGTYEYPITRSDNNNNNNESASATTMRLTVALQPHRNPAKNGISLILLERTTKLGYLLMTPTMHSGVDTTRRSQLLGVYIDPLHRKQGLSKVFLAIWMHLCLYSRLTPTTGVIQKPLLALVLQHTFGYQPVTNTGVEAQLCPRSISTTEGDDNDRTIVLYSPLAKNLQGAFSPRDIQREGMVFASSAPPRKGRVVRIGASFVPPDDDTRVLQDRVDAVLNVSGASLRYSISADDLRSAMLGR